MRVEIYGAQAGSIAPPASPTGRRWRLDAAEWAVLALFAVLSLWTVGLGVVRDGMHGLVWTHTDGVYIVDQMQYLAWIRSAAQHGLVNNMFVLGTTPADYVQPGALISGGLVLAGMAPWLALLLWKPVAVVATVLAYRAYVRTTVTGTAARRVALILAVFYASITLIYGVWGVVGDLMSVFLSWGYPFSLLAMSLMVFAVVAYGRTRERDRPAVTPGLLGAMAALLHPWQGELLILLVAGSEAVMWWTARTRAWPRYLLRTPLVTCGLTGLPLLYYVGLQRTDLSWKLAQQAGKHSFPLAAIVIALAPLVIPALAAVRPLRLTFMEVVTRVWLVAAVGLCLLAAVGLGLAPLHALLGITVPLAVLAVQGVQRLRLHRLPAARVWAVLAVGLLTVPATAKVMIFGARATRPTPGNGNFIHPGDQRALSYLAHDPQPGGVLSAPYLGALVPGLTSRQSFDGDCLWTEPGCNQRWDATFNLQGGYLAPRTARALVRASGARFVLTDCQLGTDISRTLSPMLVSVRRFGCAAVYEVRPEAPGSPALAESALDAALRASGRQ